MTFSMSRKKALEVFSLLFLSLILAWLAASRFFGFDRDYVQYLSFFESLSASYSGRFEVGFVYLALLVKSLGLSFFFLLFISSFVSLISKFYLIYKGRNVVFWVSVYVLMLYPLHEMTQIRVSIALGFGYLALYFAIRENLSRRVVLLSVLSILFHWTLLIFIPFVVFVGFFKKRKIILILSVILVPSIVIYLILSFLVYLNPQVTSMVDAAGSMKANPFSSRNIIFLMIAFIGLANINRIKSDCLPWLYLTVFGISIWYGMMKIPIFSHRVFELTMLSAFLWIPSLPKYSRFIAAALLTLLSIYLFMVALYVDPLFRSNL